MTDVDAKRVHKRGFFRYAKTQSRHRTESQSSLFEPGKRGRIGSVNVATNKDPTKRPRFGSVTSNSNKGNVFNVFTKKNNGLGGSYTASHPSSKQNNNALAVRTSVFNIGRVTRTSRYNKHGAVARTKANNANSRRSTYNWRNILNATKEKKASSQNKQINVVSANPESDPNRTPWEIRKTLSGRVYYWNKKENQHAWTKPEELMTAQEREDAKKEWVWIPHPVNLWQPAVVVAKKPTGSTQVRTIDQKLISVPAIKIMKGAITNGTTQRVPLTPLNRFSLDLDFEDLIELDDVNEGSVLHNTRVRFENGKIYTWIGPSRNVLVAVNPFEDLGLYNEEMKKKYEKSATSLDIPKPHVFGVAATCVHKLAAQGRSQSILVSGESGSGKTMATKQCLDFITFIAGSTKVMTAPPVKKKNETKAQKSRRNRKNRRAKQMPGPEESVKMVNAGENNAIEDKILKCNPIMEAFGNAKTVRNNNSSRFGKWIVMFMNMKQKQVMGARIEQFLLETTRVIKQTPNERNYHVFHQVFVDEDLAKKYDLTDPKDFHYTNQGKCFSVDGDNGIDDKKEMKDVKTAMDKLGFSETEKEWFFKIVCAILHIGNIEFISNDQKESVVDPESIAHLKKAAEVLEIDYSKLGEVLVTRTIKTSKDETKKTLTADKSLSARDSLAKAIYGKVFDYLIERINESFGNATSGRFIGILDIFGFEQFEFNSFEQLCINFTNERLQKLFNESTFLEEQDLYQMERITFDKISFTDNKIVLDIIDTRPAGIFNLLDDQCNIPGGNEDQLLKVIGAAHQEKVKLFRMDMNKRSFEINHFAGTVDYTITDFLSKNVDALNVDLYGVCETSEDAYTKALFPPLKDHERVKIKSTSGRFREQLNNLLEVLTETQCHFIRCIKPNNESKPKVIDCRKVMVQFNSAAVLDAVTTRQKGFAHKMFHDDFYTQYKYANGLTYKFKSRDARGQCKEIISECFKLPLRNLPGIQVGETRILFKTNEYKFLELNKTISIMQYVVKFQAVARGIAARKFFKNFKEIGKQLEEAIKARDVDKIEQIEKEIPARLGKLGKRYRIAPRNLEKAKQQIKEQKLWDPVKKDLVKYDSIRIKKGKTEEENELDDDVVETLDVKDMEQVIAKIIETEEKSKMPFEVKHSLRHMKTLRKIVHSHNLNKQYAELLKLDDTNDMNRSSTNKSEGDRMGTARGLDLSVAVKMNSMEEFAQKDRVKTIDFIEKEGKLAIKNLDRQQMRNVAVRATEYDYDSPLVDQLRDMLKLPEIEFLRRELDLARKKKDNDMIFEKTVQLREEQLIEEFDQYKYFYHLGTLRNPPEEVKFITCFCIPYRTGVREQSNEDAKILYGKSATTRMLNKKRKFLQWQNDDYLFFSLLRLPQDLEDLAFRCFENIFAYMEEFRSEEDGMELIKTGVFMGGGENNGLRNEIYCQIVKQLTNNPSPESRIRGVELLGLCLASFPTDDDEFESFLFVWMRLHLPYAIFRNYMAAAHVVGHKSNPNNTKYNGANEKIRENFDINEIRLMLEQSRESTREVMDNVADKWLVPNGMFKNLLAEYDVDEDFYEDNESEGSGHRSIDSFRNSFKSGLSRIKKSFSSVRSMKRKSKKKSQPVVSDPPESYDSLIDVVTEISN